MRVHCRGHHSARHDVISHDFIRMNDVFNLFLLISQKISTSVHSLFLTHTELIKRHFLGQSIAVSSYWPYWVYWYVQ